MKDERYNDGNSSGHMWNDKRTTQTQGNVVVERGGCGSSQQFIQPYDKKIKYGKWKKENMEEARMEYKKSRQNAKRVITSAQEKKQKESANDLNDSECQNEIFGMAKQMVKERQDITLLNCIKGK